MIFAFIEDGTVEIFSSEENAIQAYEGCDVEDQVVIFYNAMGQYLRPVFLTPNRRSPWRNFFGWVESGRYELHPAPKADEDSFEVAMYEAIALEPNPWFTSLSEIKQTYKAKGFSF
ncbi:MAG: hypothetical protein OXT49_03935 [Gammaproteobacteria bacterium]|nr:hypothetical protein [Gammaproteobacteria bacterium]